ncbi:MAG: hypothetical protein WC877_01865 [Dehalococcoidales bacterium]|jgi:hypothetical protein
MDIDYKKHPTFNDVFKLYVDGIFMGNFKESDLFEEINIYEEMKKEDKSYASSKNKAEMLGSSVGGR